MKAYGGVGVQFISTSPLNKGERSASRPDLIAIGLSPRYQLGGWVGHRTSLDNSSGNKIDSTIVQVVVSSLCRMNNFGFSSVF